MWSRNCDNYDWNLPTINERLEAAQKACDEQAIQCALLRLNLNAQAMSEFGMTYDEVTAELKADIEKENRAVANYKRNKDIARMREEGDDLGLWLMGIED